MTDPIRKAWNSTIPSMSKRRAAELAENGPKPRKPLGRGEGLQRTAGPKAKRESRNDKRQREQGMDDRPDYEAAHPHCELTTALNSFGRRVGGGLLWEYAPPGWQEFARVWAGHPEAGDLETHHIWGRGFDGCHLSFNLIRLCKPAHEFIQHTPVGLLLCVMEKGDASVDAALLRRPKPHPLFAVVKAQEDGAIPACLEDAAKAICRRYGV